MKKHTIWDSNINLADWQDFLEEEHPDVTDEHEQYELVKELNDVYLTDEEINLNIPLDGEILVIINTEAHGKRTSYSIISTRNVRDILTSDYDKVKWFSDGYNIKAREQFAGGVNHIEYREIRTNKNFSTLWRRICNGEDISRRTLNYYTKSILPAVANVYGW